MAGPGGTPRWSGASGLSLVRSSTHKPESRSADTLRSPVPPKWPGRIWGTQVSQRDDVSSLQLPGLSRHLHAVQGSSRCDLPAPAMPELSMQGHVPHVGAPRSWGRLPWSSARRTPTGSRSAQDATVAAGLAAPADRDAARAHLAGPAGRVAPGRVVRTGGLAILTRQELIRS